MAAPKGNYYYKMRNKNGRDKIFKTPASLLKACNEYFEWCQDNPLMETVPMKIKVSRDKEKIVLQEVPKMRPFTLQGLCNFIDISVDGFKLYEERKDYIGVTTRAREIIYKQKFEGAASGFLNANIIARDLGLADKQSLTHTVEQPLFPDE
ncbi:DNA-packaging protein gp3 [Salinimicrobium sediminis]|uniref:DNA-packaging protein gp3 n=1 Tax=Salinimicrobium sediminis TaxID=1343891 RepID=A0A285X3B3_9FLAO|nr:terminase small subunit [Salinimicrobium sediminis]SOC79837.1 DNA-packaging protein gp3 [Salinimicrobium sediminis]